MVEKEEQQHPLVNVEGVVVQVQKKERIAIAHAIHYGRIFISARFYNENIIEFGKWISMQIDSDPFNKVGFIFFFSSIFFLVKNFTVGFASIHSPL